jgi:hypothetical protein
MGKRRRPADRRGTVGTAHLSLSTALIRAETLALLVFNHESHSQLEPNDQMRLFTEELLNVRAGPFGKWFCYVQLYFASVQILIETIRRTKITSPEIEKLLSHERKRALLLEFRHDLLHGAPPLSEAQALFFANLSEVDEWTIQLREACQKVVFAFFKDAALSGKSPSQTAGS